MVKSMLPSCSWFSRSAVESVDSSPAQGRMGLLESGEETGRGGACGDPECALVQVFDTGGFRIALADAVDHRGRAVSVGRAKVELFQPLCRDGQVGGGNMGVALAQGLVQVGKIGREDQFEAHAQVVGKGSGQLIFEPCGSLALVDEVGHGVLLVATRSTPFS